MATLDLEQFRNVHRPPKCEIVEEVVALNSGKIDPSMGDDRAIFIDVPFCRTHEIGVDPRALLKNSSDTDDPKI